MSVKGSDLIDSNVFTDGEAIFVYPDRYYPVASYKKREYEVRNVIGIYDIDLFADQQISIFNLYPGADFLVVTGDKNPRQIINSGQAEGLTKVEAKNFVKKLKSQGMTSKYATIVRSDSIYSDVDENYRIQKELILRELLEEKVLAKTISNL